MLTGRRILLIISGGIAAYKSLELIRLLKKAGASVRCILTKGGAQFVTPLSVSALSEEKVYDDLWSLTDEQEMGHIRLSREADLIVVAPASADLIAKIATGRADDLASTVLLASDKPILVAPAMNPMMWGNASTKDNLALLKKRKIAIIGPAEGDMACGETGTGRMIEAAELFDAVLEYFHRNKPLAGRRAIVTSGPTHEPIDPVRFLGNKSSGKQGHAIAQALSDAGAAVTLVSGPVSIPDPHGVRSVHVETAAQMLAAVQKALPADIAVCAAAVADWRPEHARPEKMKKRKGGTPPAITLVENPDILKTIATLPKTKRPKVVVGFAAETEKTLNNARDKIAAKGCDLILANDVSGGKVFGADATHLYAVTRTKTSDWGVTDKMSAARKLAVAIADMIKK